MPSRPGVNTTSQPTQPEYGTMLEIRSVQMLSDGRSMVETWGTWRFRILEKGVLDGYMVGRIERYVVTIESHSH
jgi:Lon protease-like protein